MIWRNPVTVLVNVCKGRHTFFAFCFFISGHIMHLAGKLNHTYIEYMAAMMTFILGHSIKQDYFENKAAETAAAAPRATVHGAEPG